MSSTPGPEGLVPARKRLGTGGFSLIEVMITALLLAIGLLGMFSMQTRASAAEFEAYQRGQAIALGRDMQARLLSARGIVSGYLDPSISSTDGAVYFGSGRDAASFIDSTGQCILPTVGNLPSYAAFEACSWGQDLQGVAIKDGSGNVGAMAGARGCIIRIVPPQQNALADLYVVVVWQGVEARTDPAADSPAGQCASSVEFGTGLRRGISMRVMVPDLHKST